MAENSQHKLGRNRPDRTIISTDIETGDAKPQREVPFVVGVLGDFAGEDTSLREEKVARDPSRKLKRYKDRKFVTVDRNNFDDVMDRITPGVRIHVRNKLTTKAEEAGEELGVELSFSKMEDFEPAAIANQVPELRSLLQQRQRLQELLSHVDRSEELEEAVERILKQAANVIEKASTAAGSQAERKPDTAGPDGGKPSPNQGEE